jgi:2-amino-4-hydroxy-6-hydroxymethyldihydropteridine diphosphokinase
LNARRRVPERTAVLSLGSNLGAREERILAAASMLAAVDGIELLSLSSLYETEPLDIDTERAFINAACLLVARLSPADLLAACREIEERSGRSRSPLSRDRTLDVDIVLLGDEVVSTRELAIPHPRLAERLFVLVPLMELGSALAVPPTGATVEELALRCPRDAWVRKVSGRGTIG